MSAGGIYKGPNDQALHGDGKPVMSAPHRSILDDLSDEGLAYKVRMLSRNDLLHEPIVCAARDRIQNLSRENLKLRDAVDELHRLFEGLAAESAAWLEHGNDQLGKVRAIVRGVSPHAL